MQYNFRDDLKAIRAILGLTQAELASKIGIERITISRNELGKTTPSVKLLEQIYSFAFKNSIKLNKLKEMLWLDNLENGHKLLFHGAKSEIIGEPGINRSRKNNDFGQGFYTGEKYEQAISFISGFDKSCIYLIDFFDAGLTHKQYRVDQEWMMTIAYYRGALEKYKHHPIVKRLAEKSRLYDYIIAPIADNRMFQIINSFIYGEITDEQCKHCLAATNLGFQYVFITEKSLKNLKLVERCYVSDKERQYYKNLRSSDTRLGDDKVKLARIKYRGKGHYIDEILT
jgi:transcriptional regulator with XRE-family HTH domain